MKASGVNTKIQGETLQLLTKDGGNTWACAAGTIDSKFLPAACR